MPRNRHTVEELVITLREADVALPQRPARGARWPVLGITEHTYLLLAE